MDWSYVAVIGVGAFIVFKILSILRSMLFKILGVVGAVIGMWRILSILQMN